MGPFGEQVRPSARATLADAAAVGSALAGLAPAGVRTGARLIGDQDLGALRPLEAAAVAGAVDSRRIEFATGRALLRELIGSESAIPVAPTRAPVFPAGTVGSLAHDRAVAVAAVASSVAVVALGVDVEPADPLAEDLARIILRPDEAGLDAHLAFVLKEAVYKTWSALGGPMLDHHDVRLVVDDGGRFTGEVVGRRTFTGRFTAAAGRIVALVAEPATGAPTPPVTNR